MPSIIKRKTSHVVETSGFTVYDGDEPPRGGYRAIVKRDVIQKSKGDNLMHALVVELKAKPGSDKAKYDGWTGYPYIVMVDEDGSETNIAKEQGFNIAICGNPDPDIKVDGTPGKFKAGDKQSAPVISIGGQNPVGKVVIVQIRDEAQEDGTTRKSVDRVVRSRDESEAAAASDEPDDIEDDEDEELDDLYEEDDLRSKSLAALRKILTEEFEMDSAEAKALKSKDALVSAILEAQEGEEDDEDEDEDEEEDEDQDDEEEDDDDREAEIDAELAGMLRADLKKALTKRQPGRKFKTSETDDVLKAELKELMLQDPPF